MGRPGGGDEAGMLLVEVQVSLPNGRKKRKIYTIASVRRPMYTARHTQKVVIIKQETLNDRSKVSAQESLRLSPTDG